MNRFARRFSITVALALSATLQKAQAVTIDMVTVGNPGNAPDTRYDSIGFGSVDHAYQIGKYEVTAGQYTEFLNAVADADPTGLYNTFMGDPPVNTQGANIQRTGLSPNYSYSVAADWADRPVNHVSFWDAARFANWLHNGQPTGAQGPGTTEDGAYHDVGNETLIGRNAGALFFIPTEDEWYKAAYHDQTAGLAASYFDYPTGTNAEPGNDINETTNPGNNANYYISNFAIGSPYYRTVVGEFEQSDSPYGTSDQGGNVWEWNETAVTSSSRGLRGGSFDSISGYLQAFFRPNFDPTNENDNVGFRVASIPELPGDFNHDGAVDAADYVVWHKNLSNDQPIYDEWRANFGATLNPGGAALTSPEPSSPAIPEPSSLALVAAGLGAFVLRRRRKTDTNILNDARTNRLMRNSIALALAVSAALSQTPTITHAATVRTVALSSQQAPGMPDDVVFTGGGARLALNHAGQTAFRMDTTGGTGIWSEGSGSLALVTGASYPYPASSVGGLVLNDAGHMVVQETRWIWSDRGGTLAPVARMLDHAPGTPSGVNFLYFRPPALNNADQIAFMAELTGDGITRFVNDRGIWSEGSGSLALVVRQGDHAPGTPSGVIYGQPFGAARIFDLPVLNNVGQIAFRADLSGDGVNSTNYQGIWSEGSGSLTLVVRTGTQAPGTPEGVKFFNFFPTTSDLGGLAFNNAGQTAFVARLVGAGVNLANNHGIWSEGSGTLALVARQGDHAPGTPSGVTFHYPWPSSTNPFGHPVLNDAGQTAFWAYLADSAGVLIGNGVWLENFGSLMLVARSGDHAPGTPSGVNFSYVGAGLQLNAAGQIAFSAGLTGSGVDSTNNNGIWATDRSGALQLIARQGDLLEVAPGDFRTIASLPNPLYTPSTGNSDGRRSVFNNLGQLVFTASFTDGTSGIFVSNRVAIPEPSSLLLLAALVVTGLLNSRRSLR